jgi:hypothetical protein
VHDAAAKLPVSGRTQTAVGPVSVTERLRSLQTASVRQHDDHVDGSDSRADADAPADLETFRREVEATHGAARDKGLDEVVPSHGYTPERTRNLRWIYVHMIEEYARHNGHADLIRERIDGTVGD